MAPEPDPQPTTPIEHAIHRAVTISRYINATWTENHGYSIVGLLIAAAWNMKRNGMSRDDYLHLAATQWDALVLSPSQINLELIPVPTTTH